MPISKESIGLLVDLVENRLGSLHINDREDLKELNKLRFCRHELLQENVRSEQDNFRGLNIPFSRRFKNTKAASARPSKQTPH